MIFVRFVHFVGVALWIGGAIAAMVVAIAVRREDNVVRATAFRLLARVHALVIGPGAFITLGTGILWTMQLSGQGTDHSLSRPGLWIMEVVGLVAGIMLIFTSLPNASKLAALAVPSDQGELPPAFDRLRKRQAVVSSVSGALAVIALLAGVWS
jgi:hypothetical protein